MGRLLRFDGSRAPCICKSLVSLCFTVWLIASVSYSRQTKDYRHGLGDGTFGRAELGGDGSVGCYLAQEGGPVPSAEDSHRVESTHGKRPLADDDHDGMSYVLVVSVDGSITCLDSRSGAVRWTWIGQDEEHSGPSSSSDKTCAFDSKAPPPINHETSESEAGSGVDEYLGLDKRGAYAVEPYGDGAIYFIDREYSKVSRFPATIKQLVDNPSVSDGGKSFLTSKEDSMFALDLETGQIVWTADSGTQLMIDDDPKRSVVKLTRTDYRVAIYLQHAAARSNWDDSGCMPSWRIAFTDYNPVDSKLRSRQVRREVNQRVVKAHGCRIRLEKRNKVVCKARGVTLWESTIDAPPVSLFHVVKDSPSTPKPDLFTHVHHIVNAREGQSNEAVVEVGAAYVGEYDGKLYALSRDNFPDLVPLAPSLALGVDGGEVLPVGEEEEEEENIDSLKTLGGPTAIQPYDEACHPGLESYPGCFVGVYSYHRAQSSEQVSFSEGTGEPASQRDSQSRWVVTILLLVVFLLIHFSRRTGLQTWVIHHLGTVLRPANGHDVVLRQRGRRPIIKKAKGRLKQPDDGRGIGLERLKLSGDVLGYGSHGTVVFRGTFGTRKVAIKRLLNDFYDMAHQEVRLLQESDTHPNVTRYYITEQTDRFLYIGLELCDASLATIVEAPVAQFNFPFTDPRLEPVSAIAQMIAGIAHLHSLKIIHRDLKPHNILLGRNPSGGRSPRIMISDFGMCRKLAMDESSYMNSVKHASGGTLGWRAPELIRATDVSEIPGSSWSESGSRDGSDEKPSKNGVDMIDKDGDNGEEDPSVRKPAEGRISRAIDLFSLGCVIHYFITNGSHPFGDRYSREMNILLGKSDLGCLDLIGGDSCIVRHMVSRMIHSEAKKRPKADELKLHPFFWDASKRLEFLQDVSDRLEKEQRDPPSELLVALDKDCEWVKNWPKKLDRVFIENLGKFRKYRSDSLQDLLRAIRNKKNHYQELPGSVKHRLGSLPAGYVQYFMNRFPKMLYHLYAYARRFGEEAMFAKYYRGPEKGQVEL